MGIWYCLLCKNLPTRHICYTVNLIITNILACRKTKLTRYYLSTLTKTSKYYMMTKTNLELALVSYYQKQVKLSIQYFLFTALQIRHGVASQPINDDIPYHTIIFSTIVAKLWVSNNLGVN